MSVVVIGSLIIDNTIYVQRIPNHGETVFAKSSLVSFGGKGANQALAAHLSGTDVQLIGCIGQDSEGDQYKKHLKGNGVSTKFLLYSNKYKPGSAFITVEESGENSIIVNPGANQEITPDHIDNYSKLIAKTDILLLQQEIPEESVKYACSLAKNCNTKVVMNPSPIKPTFNINDFPCDVLILNEIESEQLSGHKCPLKSIEVLGRLGVNSIIITQGPGHILLKHESNKTLEYSPPKVNAVDTVGAGDTFAGAFASALSEGIQIKEAIQFAGTAASISVTKPGAQGAIPSKKEIESFPL